MSAPAFPITVPQRIYDAVSKECGQPFADSYLWNARMSGDVMTPHTVTAFLILKRSFGARKALGLEKVGLAEPKPFPGHPERPGAKELLSEMFPDPIKRKPRRPDWDAY